MKYRLLKEAALQELSEETICESERFSGVHRYVISWSEAEQAWMVVYAHDMREAEEKFENGEYELEEED